MVKVLVENGVSKLEARNPKFETNSNVQNTKYFVLKIGKFEIRICFGFRYSD